MTLSTITIISLLLGVYGLVAIVRDIITTIQNIIEQQRRKALKKEMELAFKSLSEAIDRTIELIESKKCAEPKKTIKKAKKSK